MPNVMTNSLVDEWLEEFEEGIKGLPLKSKILTFKEDPIALACASYRIWRENPVRRWTDLDTVVVWQDDIEQAQALRKYYRERLVISALKNTNGNSSEFRRKLGALVTDQLEITKEELGLLYRLPYFYAEDLDLDYVVENTTGTKILPLPQDSEPMVLPFRPLKKILRSRRSAETYQYWWTTQEKGVPFMSAVKTDNPLLSIIDALFERDQVDLSCRVKPQEFIGYHRNRWFYYMFDLRLPS
jgi:hypothetical protein